MSSTAVAGVVPARSHVLGLDFIRLFAALLVAGCHLTTAGRGGSLALPAGWIGVEIFFVVSGLVIAQSARARSFTGFATSRFLRLYPTAWACLAACMILSLLFPGRIVGLFSDWPTSPRYLAGSLTLLNSTPVVNAFWTLKVEISFYAIVSCLVLLRRVAWLDQLAYLLAAASSLYLILLGAQYLGLIGGPDLWFRYGLGNMLLLRHGIYLAAGVLLSSWHEGRIRPAGRAVVLLCLMAAVAEIACRARESLAGFDIDLANLFLQALLLYLAGMLAIAASLAFNRRLSGGERLRGVAGRAGAATYPFYLLHQGVGGAIMLLAGQVGLPAPIGLGAGLLGALVLSDLFASNVEPSLKQMVSDLMTRTRTLQPRLLQPA